jgi:hypothetical protein
VDAAADASALDCDASSDTSRISRLLRWCDGFLLLWLPVGDTVLDPRADDMVELRSLSMLLVLLCVLSGGSGEDAVKFGIGGAVLVALRVYLYTNKQTRHTNAGTRAKYVVRCPSRTRSGNMVKQPNTWNQVIRIASENSNFFVGTCGNILYFS